MNLWEKDGACGRGGSAASQWELWLTLGVSKGGGCVEMGQDLWTAYMVPRHSPFLSACTPTTTISHLSQEGIPRLPGHVDNNEAMEFCGQDECVEVTPETIRVRKVILNATDRARARSREKQRNK